MHITFAPREILQIDDALLRYRNFEGRGDKYNHEGDRNFHVLIDDRFLTQDEMDSFLDIYREFELRLIEEEDRSVIVDPAGNEIEPKIADVLAAIGWNVKIKPPRDEEEEAFITLLVKVKFNDRGPKCILTTNGRRVPLDEETISNLDHVDIIHVDLDIRPYDWELGTGKKGRTAYLQGIDVVQEVDRFAERLARQED